MKRFILSLLLLSCGFVLSQAVNTVTMSCPDGAPGDTVTVQVSMSVTDRVVAAEFSFPLSAPLSYVPASFKVESAELAMSTSSALKDDGLHVFFYSTSLDNTQIGNGSLFSFKVRLGRKPGTFKITPSVVLSDEFGKALSASISSADITVKASDIALSSEKIDFGHIAIRSAYSGTLGISNPGTIPLNVAAISSSSTELTVSESSFSIKPGDTKNVQLNFSPMTACSDSITLTIESDALDKTSSIVTVVADPYSVNELSVGKSTGDTGTDISVSLTMDNMDEITAVECSFALPDGVSFVNDSFKPADRSKEMNMFSSVDNGILRLYIFSESDKSISEGSGDIASFTLHAECSNGIYALSPQNVILANKELVNTVSAIHDGSIEVLGAQLVCSTVFDMGTVSLPDSPTGEFLVRNNGKKDLTIDRVTFEGDSFRLNDNCPIVIKPGAQKLLSIGCLSESTGSYSAVMTIYSNDPENGAMEIRVSCRIIEPNYLTSEVTINSDGKSGTLKVGLSNYNRISALQMNVYGLNGVSIDKSSFALTDRCQNFSYVLSVNQDGSLKILLYSIDNQTISDHDGVLFSLDFTSQTIFKRSWEIRFADILLSNENGQNISSSNEVSIEAVVTEVYDVWADSDLPVPIYDLTGRKIGDDIESLPTGIYIRNGRKLIIR